ncbi:three-helix bundle dimerization domain-containing protein [Amycolatopsis sp. NPDC101161]|uniref:three-helix bundle dimerization domain-containing protein n=1 Tax=Amycolatopsis sp. NPDC101161 TaxID=3363940 RepID=UPI003828D9D8
MTTQTLDTIASEQLDLQLDIVEDRLRQDYTGVEVHSLVERERHRFDDARIHAFVPILVERAVRESLAEPPGRHRR